MIASPPTPTSTFGRAPAGLPPGFIALFGIAVLNGVVLVSYVVERREQGLDPDEAATQGAIIRRC